MYRNTGMFSEKVCNFSGANFNLSIVLAQLLVFFLRELDMDIGKQMVTFFWIIVLNLEQVRDRWLKVETGSFELCTARTRIISTISSGKCLHSFALVWIHCSLWVEAGFSQVEQGAVPLHLVDLQLEDRNMVSKDQRWISYLAQYYVRSLMCINLSLLYFL